MREWPEVTVVGNAKTFAPLENFYGAIANKKIVAEGETLSLGAHTLQFFMAPMCHWPESMVTYEQTSKIIFTNDAFGGFGALNGGIFDDEVNLDFYEDDMRRYYANIVGKVAMMALKTMNGNTLRPRIAGTRAGNKPARNMRCLMLPHTAKHATRSRAVNTPKRRGFSTGSNPQT